MATKREVVGLYAGRKEFETAVERLTAAGFDRSSLSVLASHSSIDAAGNGGKSWRDALPALAGEVRYEAPLVTAGLIAIAAGPVGAAIAALITAGVGGVAAKEILDEVTATPHTDEFARAVEAGSIVLWVEAGTPTEEHKAREILAATGASNIHINERAAG